DEETAPPSFSLGGCGVNALEIRNDTLHGPIARELHQLAWSDFAAFEADCRSASRCSRIGGTILHWRTGEPLPEFSLVVNGDVLTSDTAGQYAYPYLDIDQWGSGPVEVGSTGEAPYAEVTILDVIRVQQHLLGARVIHDPFQLLAADVNGSGQVTVLDVLYLRRMIMGYITEFPAGGPWVFVDGRVDWSGSPSIPAQEIDQWTVDFDYNNYYTYTHHADIIAILLGDVNGSFVD
ncbi:MAG: hypothetical protein KDC54_06550, partial [Lewinella sp.]|nr:hypothetical protein [Lewinella sp.]